MSTCTFRPYEPDDLWLLPPSPREWLPEGHLAEVVSDGVDELDLKAILRRYGGVAPYHPRMLVKVLFSAYAVGIPASRQIAKELEEGIAFRVLAANQQPDFRTISDFRQQHLAALTDLFVQVLTLCQRAGLVKLGHVAAGWHQGAGECVEAHGDELRSDGEGGGPATGRGGHPATRGRHSGYAG